MKTPQIVTAKNFGESVKLWSYDRFISTFKSIYPDVDLDKVAKELGIEKPKKVTPDKDK
jgi:hypothetical protein